MEIMYKDYKITCNRYSWDLHEKHIAKKDHKKIKKGESYWTDEGFFTNLNSLLDKVIRTETEKGNETVEIEKFLQQWLDIVSVMGRNIKVESDY
jgi:calcineurin-like phosphoesterase